ncbi:uncharacterized protein [Cicer arietinum]
MDWFSWLSKTNLNPSLVYEYGFTFNRNELQLQDSIHFNHEFLQSMGISIAKHRLEILKLVNKENREVPKNTKNLSGVFKKCLKKCLSKLIFHEQEKHVKNMNMNMMSLQKEENWYQGKWRRALMSEELKGEKGMHRNRKIAMSGPLDGRMHNEKMVSINNNKVLKFSGPLDNAKMVYTNRSPVRTRPIDRRYMDTRSPTFSGPIDSRELVSNKSLSPIDYQSPYNRTTDDSDFEDSLLWRALFEDLKPT